jgi:hypothetical protein
VFSTSSVVYRGCGIPVARIFIQAGQEGTWCPYWEGLLAALEGVVPLNWKVIVMADRGLYQAIQRLGWHPMLRVKEDLSFRAEGEENFGLIGMSIGQDLNHFLIINKLQFQSIHVSHPIDKSQLSAYSYNKTRNNLRFYHT